jgi:uncharacterized membrane protein YgcG
LIPRPAPAALVTALGILAVTGACQRAPAPPSDDETTGSSTAGTQAPVGTTFVGPDACQSSEECETEGSCVAPYDPGSDPPMGQGGCIDACIEVDDLSRWCFDDAACCGAARCHTVDGLCEARAESTSDDTTAGSSSGGSSSGGSSSSSSSSGSSSSGSSGSSSSGSG